MRERTETTRRRAGKWGTPRPADKTSSAWVQRDSGFALFPAKISEAGRDALLAAFPALSHHPHAAAYLRLLEYIVFSRYEGADGRLVIPATHVADLVQRRPIEGNRWFAARDWLDAFSSDVWPLDVREHDYIAGEARSISRELPGTVQAILAAEPLTTPGEAACGQVWLATGVPVTRKRLYAEAATFTKNLRELADGVDVGHPARALMDFLNGQPSCAVGKVVRSNWPEVIKRFEAMAEGGRKESARMTLLAVRDCCRLLYSASEKTPRLHAIGATIHGLPRELRKVALSGCTSLDAKSCQLAIVAKLWHVPELSAFLTSGRSIWQELQDATGTTSDDKPALKSALYSIVFGMRDKLVCASLAKTIGTKAAGAYLGHPIILELLSARQERLREIRRARNVTDVWNRMIPYHPRHAKFRSLLAQEVQSWEMKLMLSLLPVLRAERDLTVVSWLHDGLTIRVSDRRQEARIVTRLKSVFAKEADRIGVATELEEG